MLIVSRLPDVYELGTPVGTMNSVEAQLVYRFRSSWSPSCNVHESSSSGKLRKNPEHKFRDMNKPFHI